MTGQYSGDMSVAGGEEQAPLDLLRELLEVSGRVRAEITTVLVTFGLNESLAGLLWALDPAGGGAVEMRQLAGLLACDPSNVTLMSNRLEARGLVARRSHPTDGRVRVLELTEEGQQLWRDLSQQLAMLSPVHALSAQEQTRLRELLGKIQQQA